MRLGLIADIHANAPALEAVLAALDRRGVERIVALGDLVGYHALPHETLAAFRARGIPSVAGNHDQMVVGRLPAECGPRGRRAVEWTRHALSPDEVAQLASLPDAIRPGPHMLCVHATLDDPTRRLRTDAELEAEATRVLAQEPGVTVCVMGHSHRAFVHTTAPETSTIDVREVEIPLPRRGFTFVNPGSVGEPRGGEVDATFAVFDSRTWGVTLHQVPYDHGTVEAADRKAALLPERPEPAPTDRREGFWSLLTTIHR